MRVHQCAVMGSGGVGKSALTVRFINGSYLEWYDPTIEDSYRKQFSVDGQPCLLEILDTAGVDQYLTLNDLFIRDSEGFILVFSLTQRDTFEEVGRLRETIMRMKSSDEYGESGIPLVMVGNKADLAEEREIDSSEAEKLAAAWGCTYHETSARTDTNTSLVFEDIVRQLRKAELGNKRRDPILRKRGRKCVVL